MDTLVVFDNTKMHYHMGIYFQGGVSQLEKYGSYRNWTVDYNTLI